jgi:hypothetical protein
MTEVELARMGSGKHPSVRLPSQNQGVVGSPPCEALRRGAVGYGDYVNLGVSVRERNEGDVLAVWGKAGIAGRLVVIGETPGAPAAEGGHPDVIGSDEGQ